ncbi:hypothetical protein M5K25_003542 [Dendrobium thyrsiflorum]|uniref:Glycylpeptide N-tetradecanoyltransferase n=1 Tax=Dendrobium thyrsiflorum TaxID=117978 RepID=A0ABD0VJ99_DENTH
MATDESSASSAAAGGSRGEKIDEIASLIPLLTALNKHPFWETQPVPQFAEAGDLTLPDGPILPQIPSSDVKQDPYNLPAQFEWTDIDIDDESTFSDLHRFVSNNYADSEAPLPFPYSPCFLRWLLRDPNQIKSLHVGVSVKNTKKLIGFIAATPAMLRIGTETFRVAVANVLCVHKKLRSKRLVPVLVRELARRAQLEGIWQGVFTTERHLPTPICTSRLLYRFLNPKKMKRCGHVVKTSPLDEISIRRLNKWYKVAKTVETRGFRKMDAGDVTAVSEMLNIYLKKFEVALEVDEHFVEHFLLPKPGIVDCYVVEDSETNKLTDFCSFLIHSVEVENDPKYSELKCVVLFYYATYETAHLKLMKDVLVMAKEDGADLFMAYDIMGNLSFLDGLLFRPKTPKNDDDWKEIYYYFYNYRMKEVLETREVALII